MDNKYRITAERISYLVSVEYIVNKKHHMKYSNRVGATTEQEAIAMVQDKIITTWIECGKRCAIEVDANFEWIKVSAVTESGVMNYL